MKELAPDERNSKTFALLIIFSLIISLLMRGINIIRYNVPYLVFISIVILCALISVVSYIGFLYYKSKSPNRSQLLPDLLKIIVLGVMVYFIIAFPIGIISNQ